MLDWIRSVPSRRHLNRTRAPRAAAVLGAAALAFLLAAGPARAQQGLTIGAAANLTPVMKEAQRRYAAETGEQITLAFGASGSLAQQIENGAPYQLFLSADESWMARLAKTGAIEPRSIQPFAEGRLVLLLAQGELPGGKAPLDAAGLALLKAPAIRYIAIANPRTAPFGRAAQQALRKAGLWAELQPKLVYGENIRQAEQFVESGNADAGLIAQSLVMEHRLSWRPLEPTLYDPLRQTLGIVKGAPAEAARFAEWLLSDAGQTLVARFGYGPVRPAVVDRAR